MKLRQDSRTSLLITMCLLFFGLECRSSIAPEVSELQKLVHPEAMLKDQFGYAVAISGETLAVGMPRKSSVYVFQRDASTTQWLCTRHIFMPIGWFGGSIDLDGDTLVVGATYDLGQRGTAHVFERNQGGPENWGLSKSLVPDWGTFEFGKSAGISGDTIVVSQMGGRYRPTFVYQRDEGGTGQWGKIAELQFLEDVDARFGYSAAIDGDTVVVGAITDQENGVASGTAYVYSRHAGGLNSWGLVKKLTPADGAQWDDFGESVDVHGDFIIVGSREDDDSGINSGSAYLFARDAGGVGNWGQVGKLLAADGSYQDGFGHSVAISEDYIVIGAWRDDAIGFESGSAYLFRLDANAQDHAAQVAKIVPSDGSPLLLFGWRVAIDNGSILIGAPVEVASGNPEHTGYAYAYAVQDSSFYEQLPDLDPSYGTGSSFNGQSQMRVADAFIPSRAGSPNSVRWWGSSPDGVESFTVEFLSADGPNAGPGTVLHSQVFLPADCYPAVEPDSPWHAYEVELAMPLPLSAQSRYWLSITATMVQDGQGDWVWALTPVGTYDGVVAFDYLLFPTAWESLENGGGWGCYTEQDVAFCLDDRQLYEKATPTALAIQLDDAKIYWWVQRGVDDDVGDSTRSNEWPFCDSGSHVPIELGNSTAVLERISAARVSGGARFDYNIALSLGDGDESAGTYGWFEFTLGEPVYYKVSGQRLWSGSTVELLSDYFSLVSLTTGDTIYEESEESFATGASHAFNMIADGPFGSVFGANLGQLPAGQYQVSFQNAVWDSDGQGVGDGISDMAGETSVTLQLSKTPFPLEPINRPPSANAGFDVFVPCQESLTQILLNGGASIDPDGDPLTFEWSVPPDSGASLDDLTSPTPTGWFPLGSTTVTLTVSDGRGGVNTDEVVVTVEPGTMSTLFVRVLDQWGNDIAGSAVMVLPSGDMWLSGSQVSLAPGDYTFRIMPRFLDIDPLEAFGSALARDEMRTITPCMSTLDFVWPVQQVQINIVDQDGAQVVGHNGTLSQFNLVRGSALNFNSGDILALPITDESEFPNAVGIGGAHADGYDLRLRLAVLDTDPATPSLGRDETAGTTEVGADTTVLNFVWPVRQVQVNIVDQHGVPIVGATGQPSRFKLVRGGYADYDGGTVLTLPVTDESLFTTADLVGGGFIDGYDFRIRPAILDTDTAFGLFRDEIAGTTEVGSDTTELTFVWPVQQVQIHIVDQHGDPIIGKVGQPSRFNLVRGGYADYDGGTVLTLPVTDESLFTTADLVDGGFLDGYDFRVRPAILDLDTQFGLFRDEIAGTTEIGLSTTSVSFEWRTVSGNLRIVDQAEQPLNGAAAVLFGSSFVMQNGLSVSLPITDLAVYPSIGVGNPMPYRIYLRPDDLSGYSGPFDFELLGSGGFSPAFQDVGGQSVGLRLAHNQLPTTLVTVALETCEGAALEGMAYWSETGAPETWSLLGPTPVTQELPTGQTYGFKVVYGGGESTQSVAIGDAPVVVRFQTTRVAIFGESVRYFADGWVDFPQPSLEMLSGEWAFEINGIPTALSISGCAFGGGMLRLVDAAGNPLAGGVARPAYGGSWLAELPGATDVNGNLWCDLGSDEFTKIKMTVNQTSQEKSTAQLQSDGYTWQTATATLLVKDAAGTGLVGAVVDQGGGFWDLNKAMTDASGVVTIPVFPGTAKFRVTFNKTNQQITQSVPSTFEFQTGQVHSESGSCIKWASGSWNTFTQDMEVFPGSYRFVFSDGTPTTYYTILPGQLNVIH